MVEPSLILVKVISEVCVIRSVLAGSVDTTMDVASGKVVVACGKVDVTNMVDPSRMLVKVISEVCVIRSVLAGSVDTTVDVAWGKVDVMNIVDPSLIEV